MAKYTDWLTWTVIVLIGLGCLWLVAEPIVWWTDKSELRIYIRVFLLMFAVGVFAVLRLYNSIVNNSRFIIKLHEAVRSLTTHLTALERTTKVTTNSMGGLKTAITSHEKATKENSEAVHHLSEKVKLNKTTKKS